MLSQVQLQKVKIYVLYRSVASPLDRSKRFTLHPWQTCSFRHQVDLYGKYSSHVAITCEDYSLTFPPPSIARYSRMQLSELRRRGENENVHVMA